MKVYSPWTADEVRNLNFRQKVFHPYTCEDCGAVLIAEEFGWICSNPYCDYMQNWALDFDLERGWKKRQ